MDGLRHSKKIWGMLRLTGFVCRCTDCDGRRWSSKPLESAMQFRDRYLAQPHGERKLVERLQQMGQTLIECAIVWALTLAMALGVTKVIGVVVNHHFHKVAERVQGK